MTMGTPLGFRKWPCPINFAHYFHIFHTFWLIKDSQPYLGFQSVFLMKACSYIYHSSMFIFWHNDDEKA